jgi:hypothetical protein
MRTAKYERAEPLAPHVTFVHYDVPEPNLHSMVDQLGGIAYARGTSILSQASDDYLFADGDGEDEDYDFSGDEETQGLAGARRDHRDDEADPLEAVLDFETVYWSTEEDVVSSHSPRSAQAFVLTSSVVWPVPQAEQAAQAQVPFRRACALSRISGEVPRSAHASGSASTRDSVAP